MEFWSYGPCPPVNIRVNSCPFAVTQLPPRVAGIACPRAASGTAWG